MVVNGEHSGSWRVLVPSKICEFRFVKNSALTKTEHICGLYGWKVDSLHLLTEPQMWVSYSKQKELM